MLYKISIEAKGTVEVTVEGQNIEEARQKALDDLCRDEQKTKQLIELTELTAR